MYTILIINKLSSIFVLNLIIINKFIKSDNLSIKFSEAIFGVGHGI